MSGVASTIFLVAMAALYLFWGTMQTLSLKWSDTIIASDGFYGPVLNDSNGSNSGSGSDSEESGSGTPAVRFRLLYSFAHPFTQAFFMFCAESCCFLVFVSMLAWKKYVAPRFHKGSSDEGGKLIPGEDYALPCNPCVWMLTAGADFLGSIVMNVGMVLTYASVYQMLRAAGIIWIALVSHIWLGRRFIKVELWGMACVVIGISLVQLSSILSGKTTKHDQHEYEHASVGNCLVILAQLLYAYQAVCEERLIRLYSIPPLQVVGTEGVYGVGMTLTLLAFLQLFPMSAWGHNLAAVEEFSTASGVTAVYTNVTWVQQLQPAAKVPYDDVVLAFAQVRDFWKCRLFILIYVTAGFVFNGCQMAIIKHVSATATVMLGSLRNVTVWLVCLLIPSVFGEHFSVLQLVGFVFLVLGNVLFQRVWITHFDEVLPAGVIDACPVLFHDVKRENDAEGETSPLIGSFARTD